MVWKETGKFGVHTGRTLRKSAEQSCNKRDSGFLIKTVTNPDINFTDEDIRRCLKKFQIQDGLNVESVIKESRESRHRRLWHVGGRGIHDNSVLYSLGKRKRWLVSTVLREQIPEDYDSENDYNVVLVERESLNNSPWYCRSPRLKRGDCNEVVDGQNVRKPKRRKFAHVGDLWSSSDKTEIFYEVNHSESASSWPSFLQYDWREFRDQNKARCKQKGTKNKRRMWGELTKNELEKTQLEGSLDQDMKATYEEEEEMVLKVDNFEHCPCSMLDEHDFVKRSIKHFDIGNYIWEVLTATPAHSGQNKYEKRDKRTPTTVNPASSHIAQQHGKGSAVHIDFVDSLHNGYHDNTVSETPSSGVNAPLAVDGVTNYKAVSVNVDIESKKLHPCALQAQFGELYKEGDSMPRRFSINSPTDQSTKFVITCWPNDAYKSADNRTERVAVTVISDSVPSKKCYDCKELLRDFSAILEQGSQIEEESPCNTLFDQSQCISDDTCEHPCRVAVMPFELVCDINRWSYKVSLPSIALPDGLPSNAVCNKSMANGQSNLYSLPDTVACEICCCEFYLDSCDETKPKQFSCTAMKSCSHWFCNDCWKAYLSAQLQQGKIIIKCPAYDCDTPVDDVTFMGLLPDRYLKFLTMRQEKIVEKNAEWQWCPGDTCNLVVKATAEKSAQQAKEEVVPVPIYCHCGYKWCFACQEEPHWPASCAEAAFFRSQTETYEKLIRAKTGGITSVNVKRCPHCRYPIEKNKGCPHMSCIMCKGEFCWTCLGNWANHHWEKCDKDLKQEEEVELVNHIGSTRFNRHLRVAIENRIARAGPILYEKYSTVKELRGVLQTHKKLSEGGFGEEKVSLSSASFSLLSLYNSHEVPKYLKSSIDFNFQAHFVIEGVSILMAVSKTKRCHGKLQRLVSTLLFVADRLEDMTNNRKLYSETDKVHFKRLMKAGTQCIDCIRKLCIKAHQN